MEFLGGANGVLGGRLGAGDEDSGGNPGRCGVRSNALGMLWRRYPVSDSARTLAENAAHDALACAGTRRGSARRCAGARTTTRPGAPAPGPSVEDHAPPQEKEDVVVGLA